MPYLTWKEKDKKKLLDVPTRFSSAKVLLDEPVRAAADEAFSHLSANKGVSLINRVSGPCHGADGDFKIINPKTLETEFVMNC